MLGMTAKELVRKRLPRWSEEQAQRALRAAEPDAGGAGDPSTAENTTASTVQAKRPKKKQPKKVGRLSFFAIGAGRPRDPLSEPGGPDEPDELPVPEAWRTFEDGTPQPNWTALIRADRDHGH
jgi:hypothetical protein